MKQAAAGILVLCLWVSGFAQSSARSEWAAVAQSKYACLAYKPAIVTLTGSLVRRTYPGPPNYDNIRNGDRPEPYWFLVLPHPVCVGEDVKEPDLKPAQKGVRRVQLVFKTDKMYRTKRALLGKRVAATGWLYGAISAHHHTPVLLWTTGLEKAK